MTQSVPGTLRVSNDCISDLAGYAALECYGIVGMAYTNTQDGVTQLLPVNRLRKGIDVAVTPEGVTIDLHVIVEQGVNMASVTKNLTGAVKFTLKSIADMDNVEVLVHIEGMRSH
jgi:uncharacterized alkaline shock family protein YloU